MGGGFFLHAQVLLKINPKAESQGSWGELFILWALPAHLRLAAPCLMLLHLLSSWMGPLHASKAVLSRSHRFIPFSTQNTPLPWRELQARLGDHHFSTDSSNENSEQQLRKFNWYLKKKEHQRTQTSGLWFKSSKVNEKRDLLIQIMFNYFRNWG